MFNSKIINTVITFCFTLVVFSTNSFAQSSSSLDDDFLNSLPEDVQKELTEDETEAQSPVDKLLNSKTSSLKNREALKIIQKQLAVLEKKMDQDKDDSSSIERFGLNFFNSTQSTFMPVNVPNLNGDYIVDVGDKLSINIVGSDSTKLDNVFVDRDGSISLQEFGKVFIAGKNFDDVQIIIDSFVQAKSIGNEVFVTLAELRDIQVIMLGEVESPGIYTVAGGSNVLHALNVAGGINSAGSFRNISVIRSGKEIYNLDLYETLVFGKTNIFNFNLRSSDTIFTKPIDFFVPISGGVNKPSLFDIKDGETLADLVGFAGGFSQDSFNSDSIILERDNLSGTDSIEIPKNNLPSIKLQPRDVVIVPKYKKEIKAASQVTVSGAVNRPGKYTIKDGATLSQVISMAGGYKDDSYEFGGLFYRKSIQELDTVFGKRIYADTINFLVSNLGQGAGGGSQQPLTGDFLKILIEEFQSQDPIGRVIVDFDLRSINSNPSLDIRLEDQDIIEIPSMPQHVYLFGDFNQPVTLPYNPEFNVNDYMELAAGKKSSATEHIILIDPNGMSHYFEKQRFNMFSYNHDIYPGSIIYLPRELGKVEGVMFAAAVAPILSSLTLSLASINSITND